MERIHTDNDFKRLLSGLSVKQQRRVGKLFVERVMELSDNPKVRNSLSPCDRDDASITDISDSFATVKSAAIDSYTLCGREADWLKQAEHFVAAAAASCLSPEEQTEQCKTLAWTTAMNARMARVCANIAHGVEADNSEAASQYEILAAFLADN